MGAARRPRKPVGLEPAHSDPPYAQRSGALRCGGVGGATPDYPDVPWQPSLGRGQSSGDAVSAAALTGLALAALTGRGTGAAQRSRCHTALPPGGRLGEARRSDRWSALPSPRGARTWRRPQPVEADAGGWNARTARTASHNRRWGAAQAVGVRY